MHEYVQSRVSVLFFYDGEEDFARPVRLLWQGREFELGTVKFWHTTHHGERLDHHYTVSDTDMEFNFQLSLNTESMTWVLQQATPFSQPESETIKLPAYRPQAIAL